MTDIGASNHLKSQQYGYKSQQTRQGENRTPYCSKQLISHALSIAHPLHPMEVDFSPQDGARPGTPLLGENSDPPSGPTTPTPLPQNSLKRRALFLPQKTPNAAPAPISHMPQAPLICEQVGMVADN